MEITMQLKKYISMVVLTTLFFGFLGCAMQPTPTEELVLAESQIEQAKKEYSYQYEPLLIKKAEDKLASAKSLLDDDKNGEAKYLLDEAKKDAEAAIALSSAKKSKKLYEQSQNSQNMFKQQLDNQSEPTQPGEQSP
jgi:hypothetical protein